MKRLSIVLVALAAAAALSGCGAVRAPAPSGAPSKSGDLPASSGASAPVAQAVPTTWAGLGAAPPLWIQRSAPGPAGDPARPQILAYCAPGAVRVSRDGGSTWKAFSTGGVVAATAHTPFPVLAQGGAPTCTGAVADPAQPGSAYAAFAAGPASSGMPPVYSVPLYTTDGGAHWRVVAPPPGLTAGGFGGFQVTAGGVQAMFGRSLGVSAVAGPAFGLTVTTDGGATWHTGTPACPGAGPCAVWGPAASGIGSCAMAAYAQPVLASANGGRTWAALPPPAGAPLPLLANGCALNQLAALSQTRLALIANAPPAPADALRISDDGGKTWTPVALPALPSGGSTLGLQMLPGGALIAPVLEPTGSGQYALRLQWLKPGAAAWCTVPGVALASGTDPASLGAAGTRLWWVEGGAAPTLKSVALNALHCSAAAQG